MRKSLAIILFIVTLLFCVVITFGQTVLIKDKIPNNFSNIDNGFGPNRKHYSYSYLAIGKIVSIPIPDSVLSVRWNAMKLSSGLTKKYQANKYIGLLFDFDLSVESFALQQIDSITTLNYNTNINKARYVFYKVSTDLAIQFNFNPKRGNQLGTYLTLGGYVDYNISRRFVTKAKFENGYKVNQKVVYKKLPFATPFQYGGVAKFGKHYWDLFARYRISNSFDNGQIELPRLIVGFEFLIHEND